MKKIILSFIILLLLASGIFLYNNKNKEYSKNLFYMDTYINVKIYTNNKKKAIKILNQIDKIYEEYHMLTDRYNGYVGLTNIYEINNNLSKKETLKLDSKLYQLIDYGINWYKKSNGLININLGNVIDVWKTYRDNENGIPSLNELKKSGSTNINDIVLLDNNEIKNNHPNIDLGCIAKGYATKVVAQYLKENNINKFIINAGGNVVVGDKYHKDVYKIGIQSPIKKSEIFKVIKGENIAVVTSGSYERYYEYNNKIYHHIIDPKSYFPPNYIKSVTVIANNSALGDILSTTLFLMDIESGKEYLKQYKGVEAIWYTNDNKTITTEGINKYE